MYMKYLYVHKLKKYVLQKMFILRPCLSLKEGRGIHYNNSMLIYIEVRNMTEILFWNCHFYITYLIFQLI